MKRITCMMLLFLVSMVTVSACPVCERNQPDVLKGITHGAGPESRWDYLVVWICAGIVLVTLFYAARRLLYPGEESRTHIKRMVLQDY